MFNSEDTSSYQKTVVFSTTSLDSSWSHWDSAPSLAEGIEVDSLCALPGLQSLLMFCSYNWVYGRNKKKTDLEPTVMYFIPGKGWRRCTWGGEMSQRSNVFVTRMGDELMCFSSNELFRATKAYEWTLDELSISVRAGFHLEGMSIFPEWSSNKLLLSQDGRTFKKLTLEDGTWRYLCANEQGLLCLYSPNAHETSLRTGSYRFQPQP